MRPIMKITLCAFVAAAGTIPASPVFAKDVLKLLATVTHGVTAGPGEQIDVESFSWGETRAKGKVDYGWKVEEGESAPPAPGGAAKFGAVSGVRRDESMTRKGSKISDRPLASGVRVPAGDVNGDGRAAWDPKNDQFAVSGRMVESRPPRSTGWYRQKPVVGSPKVGTAIGKAIGNASADGEESAAPAEKRQHGWVTVSKPLDRGAVMVKGRLPGCRVGAAYPDAVLQTSADRYELKDVVIADCARDSVSLNYAKVTVRGWDPSKKQE